MYLPEAAVRSFLDAVRRSTGYGSRVLFSYMLVDNRGRVDVGRLTGLLHLTLRLGGEPLLWGVGARRDLVPLLEARGFRLIPPRIAAI
jgi:O-methyltransferase involved in polyketide biosynthesis